MIVACFANSNDKLFVNTDLDLEDVIFTACHSSRTTNACRTGPRIFRVPDKNSSSGVKNDVPQSLAPQAVARSARPFVGKYVTCLT